MELKEWWDVEYKIEKVEDQKFPLRLVLFIKNHSPYENLFEYYLKRINVKDSLNMLKFYLYTGLGAKNRIKVGKYSKERIEFKIPKLLVSNDTLSLEIGIRKVNEEGEKVVKVEIPV